MRHSRFSEAQIIGMIKEQEADNPTTPLATSKTSRIINHTNETEPPPMLKPL